MLLERTFRKIELVSGGMYGRHETVKACPESEANVVTSRLQTPGNMHAPALDIDFPARLTPSKTEGHYHLYLDLPMPWKRYRKLMKALKKAGVIEEGYYEASKAQGESTLRLPSKDTAVQRTALLQRALRAEEKVKELTEEVENLQDLVTALRKGSQHG